MSVDVTVVVPVFNAGPNIVDCLGSLRRQTLPRERFDVVVVDDGSTDGTGGWLDRAAADEPDWLTVHHIENSGWAGRPRNVGIAAARGGYVQLLDSDDALGPTALARQWEVAVSSDADVVLGKLVSDFRAMNHAVFRETVTRRTFRDFPMVETLPPHKMFRRQFLLDHAIAFPEGPRYIEDELFSVHAYLHAESVAVVGDTPCYYYQRRRDSGAHLGDTTIEPELYYETLDDILDLIDEHLPESDDRAQLQARFYRHEMLGRLRGGAMLRYPAAYRRRLVTAIRPRATQRIPPSVRDGLPPLLRPQSQLLLDGDDSGLLRYAEQLEQLRLTATVREPRWDDGCLLLDIEARLELAGAPLVMRPCAGGGWQLPPELAPPTRRTGAEASQRCDIAEQDLAGADVDCAVVSRHDATLWSTVDGLGLTVDDAGQVGVTRTLVLDPSRLAGGSALPAGLWDIRLRIGFAGVTRTCGLRSSGPATDAAWVETERSVAAYWTASQTLALDVEEWMHPLHDFAAGEATRTTSRGRRLTVTVPALSGSPTAHRPAQLVLEPMADGTAPITCPARLDAAAGTVRAKLPRLPRAGGPWALWLSLGPPGGAPPVRVSAGLIRGPRGTAVITASEDDPGVS